MAEAPAQPAQPVDERTRTAVAALLRAVRPEPRLRIGEAEAVALAPLVTEWLQRGATPAQLADALIPGLPVPVHSPAAILRSRLQRKMPPVPGAPAPDVEPLKPECEKCHDPVPRPGVCRPCAGFPARPVNVNNGTPGTLARAALAAALAAIPTRAVPTRARPVPGLAAG